MTDPAPRRPFDDLRRALADTPPQSDDGTDASPIRLDVHRRQRTGSPEIVYGAGKTPDQVRDAMVGLASMGGRAIATRCEPAALVAVAALDGNDWRVETDPIARTAVLARDGSRPPAPAGLVGIVAAGTSDLPVAGEAVAVLRELGCGTRMVVDVGVAGLHRLVAPLEALVADGVSVLLVVAGMDGALPSVVAGLVSVPVIGVPASTGYGLGGDGTAALMTMLQSCAPGLTVVNIDNGVGAAIAAARVIRARTV